MSKICKTCNKDHDGLFGSGVYCSRSCANSRGARSSEVKAKIRESNKLAAKNRDDSWYEKVAQSNRSAERIAKVKKQWFEKRNYENVHWTTLRKYLKEDVGHCECCGLDSWMDKVIPLEVHHKNGNNKDNTRENLVVLCCNCHAQTDNWKGRK